MDCSRPPPRAGTRTQATTVSLCTSSPAHRSISVSMLLPSAVRRSLSSRSLRCVLVATVLSPPRLPRLTHRRAHWRQGASTSPDGGGNFHPLRVGRKGPWILIGAPRAPRLPAPPSRVTLLRRVGGQAEAVELGGVPGHDAVDRALGQALELVCQHLLRARPRALRVRVVRAPHEAAVAGEGQVREPDGVVLEGDRALAAEVLARQQRELR